MIRVWYDVETTGLSLQDGAGVCQFACFIEKNGTIVDTINYNIDISSYKREVKVSSKALEINGRSLESLYEGVTVEELIKELCEKLPFQGKAVLVGYNNTSFDSHFLRDLFEQTSQRYTAYFDYKQVDVFEFVKALHLGGIIEAPNGHSLVAMADLVGVKQEKAHEALADILMTRDLYYKLIEGLQYVSNKTV